MDTTKTSNQGGHPQHSRHTQNKLSITAPHRTAQSCPAPSTDAGLPVHAHLKLLAFDSRIACRSAFSKAALEGLSGSGGGIAPPPPPPPAPPAPIPLIRSGLDCNLARAGEDLSTDAGRAGRGGGGNRLVGSNAAGKKTEE